MSKILKRNKMDGKKTVEIFESDYKKLLSDQQFLNALERSGVDNWDGYEYACEDLDEEN